MYKNLLLLIFILVLGCESNEQIKIVETQLNNPGYLRLPLSDNVTTLDPGIIYKNVQIEVVEQLFMSLTEFDPKTNEVIPSLSTGWQIRENGQIYTYKLRRDVKWTDGTPVTAHDVVWSIQRNLSVKTDSFYVFLLYSIKNAKAIHQGKKPISSLGVRAIDDYTVEFSLEQPINYFPALTSFWIYYPLPRQAIEQYGENWTKPDNIQTNGPYKLTKWQLKEELILAANPNYYAADKVKIPKIHYFIINDSSLGLAMYKKNELDIIGGQTYLPIPLEAKVESNPVLRKEKQIVSQSCTEWYGFTVQQPPLDNPLVRKAIAAAIDKKILLNIMLKANHLPALSFIRPPIATDTNLYSAKETKLVFDPIYAKEWLAQAGYPDGKGFPKLFLVHNSSELHHKTAITVKKMLKHYLNIEVEIREFEFERYLNILKNPNEPLIFRNIWCSNYPGAFKGLREAFHLQQGINWIGWNNKKFAKLVDKAQQTQDKTKRQQLYQQAEKILVETEAAIVPLYFYNSSFLVKPWVKNWDYKEFGGQDIHNWSLE